jgi:hypothetical protein
MRTADDPLAGRGVPYRSPRSHQAGTRGHAPGLSPASHYPGSQPRTPRPGTRPTLAYEHQSARPRMNQPRRRAAAPPRRPSWLIGGYRLEALRASRWGSTNHVPDGRPSSSATTPLNSNPREHPRPARQCSIFSAREWTLRSASTIARAPSPAGRRPPRIENRIPAIRGVVPPHRKIAPRAVSTSSDCNENSQLRVSSRVIEET